MLVELEMQNKHTIEVSALKGTKIQVFQDFTILITALHTYPFFNIDKLMNSVFNFVLSCSHTQHQI